jgi:hypothetical protein
MRVLDFVDFCIDLIWLFQNSNFAFFQSNYTPSCSWSTPADSTLLFEHDTILNATLIFLCFMATLTTRPPTFARESGQTTVCHVLKTAQIMS